ncbi:MAG: transcriptional regulator [Pseudomonadota bacterium]
MTSKKTNSQRGKLDSNDPCAQGEFLRDAMLKMDKNRGLFADRFGTTKKTLNNWLEPPESKEFRKMSRMAWKYISETLKWEGLT